MAEIALDIQLGVESQNKDIEISVSKRRKYMSMSIEKSMTPVPEYDGPYNVVSRLYYGQALPTEGKKMVHDLVVDPVPIHEVSNPMGGITVTIGSL